jgi:integrase
MTQSTREESFDSDRPAAQRQLSRPRIHPLSAEQLQHLLTAAQGDPMHLFFFVSGTTGMRIGEVLSLKWQDLDLNQQTLSVCRTLLFQPPQSFLEAKLKRARDFRTIHLVPIVVAALKRHLTSQQDLRLQAGGSWQDHGFVFCTGSGIPLQSSKVATAYKTFLQKAGISLRSVHTLRYSAMAILLCMGTHPDVVRVILGLRPQKSSVIVSPSPDILPRLISEAILGLNQALQE